MKHPSTNIQVRQSDGLVLWRAPEKHQHPNTKDGGARFWSLVLGASLDVGAWNLELYDQ
jgi:hypothetical protein